MGAGFILYHPQDYANLGLNVWDYQMLSEKVYAHELSPVLENVSHRLTTAEWMMNQAIKAPPAFNVTFHDIVSQVVYMLLTCAESMGRAWAKGNWERFEAFFDHLPQHTKDSLLDAFLIQERPWPIPNQEIIVPDRTIMREYRTEIGYDAAWDELISCFYGWRNMSTHDTAHPAMSGSPDFMVVYRKFLPNSENLDDTMRVPMAIPRQKRKPPVYYWVFMESADPVADIRRAVVQGMGVILDLP